MSGPGLPFPQAVLCAGTLQTQPQIQRRQTSLPLYLCDRGSRRAGPASQRQAEDSLSHQAKDFSESLCFPYHFLPSSPPLHFLFFLPLSPPPSLALQPCPLLSENRNKAQSVDNHDFLMGPLSLLGARDGPSFSGTLEPLLEAQQEAWPLEPPV